MAITDLTNTTWNIPAGWTASAGYGQFNVTNTMYGTISATFYIGYDFNAAEESINAKANVVSNTVYGGVSNTNGFSLKITGGADATNPDLISWLETNGTQVIEEPPSSKETYFSIMSELAQTIAEKTGAELPLSIDEMIDALGSSSINIITFTINSYGTYQAEEGMTWYEWINSDYGGGDGYNWTCSSTTANVMNIAGTGKIQYNGTNVIGSDKIVANATYTVFVDNSGFPV